MAITHITSLAQLDGILNKSPEKLTVSWYCVLTWHRTHPVLTYLTGHRLSCYVVRIILPLDVN